MGKLIDRSGRQYGNLVVQNRVPPPQGLIDTGTTYWLCRCKCGTNVIATAKNLDRGGVKRCIRCSSLLRRLDFKGRRFGKLIVEEYEEEKSTERLAAYWKCRCDCGNTESVGGNQLKTNPPQGCFTCTHGGYPRDLTGFVSGNWTVVASAQSTRGKDGVGTVPRWTCKCKCGAISIKTRTELVSPRVVRNRCRSCPSRTSIGKDGYVSTSIRGSGGKYIRVREHVVVMSSIIGRDLYHGETVHHINGIRSDNRPENLELRSKSHPSGQRVTDKVTFAVEILRRYRPDCLVKKMRGAR